MIRSAHDLQRWLSLEIWGREIRPKPPRRARRERPAQDAEYRAWIRTHPCTACGSLRDVEASHTGGDGGTSLKASDYSCIPLCADCHRLRPDSYHALGRREFERRHGLDCAIAAKLYSESRPVEKPAA